MFPDMAGTILKNILQFTGLVVGTPVSLPHLLELNLTKVVPNLIALSAAGFAVTADNTNVTVTRQASATTGNVNIYVEQWHSIETVEPGAGLPSGDFPFVISAGGSSSSAPLTPAFTYVATGAENPAGFMVNFPSGARGGVPYIAIVQVSNYQVGGFVEANAPPSGYADSNIQVRTAAQLNVGDTLAVVIIDA